MNWSIDVERYTTLPRLQQRRIDAWLKEATGLDVGEVLVRSIRIEGDEVTVTLLDDSPAAPVVDGELSSFTQTFPLTTPPPSDPEGVKG